jgi:hypothetical protein
MSVTHRIDKIIKILKLLAEVIPVDLRRLEEVLSILTSIAYQEDPDIRTVFYARIKVDGNDAEGIVVVRQGTLALSGPRHNELLNTFFCAMRMTYPTLTGCTLFFEECHI